MKKKWILILIILVIVLLAIVLSLSLKNKSIENSVSFGSYIEEEANYGYEIKVNVNRFTNKDFSDQLYQLYEIEWGENYENMTPEEKLVHSGGRFYGSCYQYFDTWAECEVFVGVETHNPLEDCTWLTKGDHGTGLNLIEDRPYEFAYPDRYHTQVHFVVDRGGNISLVSMDSGYYQDDIRITLTATRYGENMDTCDTATISAEPIEQSYSEITMLAGNTAIAVTNSTDKFSSVDVYFIENDVLYKIRVVGDSVQKKEVQEMADEILELFN